MPSACVVHLFACISHFGYNTLFTSHFLVLGVLTGVIWSPTWLLLLMDMGRHCSSVPPCPEHHREVDGFSLPRNTSGYPSFYSWIPLSSFPWETYNDIQRSVVV